MVQRIRPLLAALALALLLVAPAAGCGSTTTTATTPAGSGSTQATATTTPTPSTSVTSAEKITLRYAFDGPEESFPGAQMKWWAAEMEKRTNGQVTVQTLPAGTLFTAENMYEGVLGGVADIGLSFTTYRADLFPLLSINDLPGLGYTSATQGSKAFFDVVWANQDIVELKDFQVITAFCTEPSYIQTIKEYTTLEGLKNVPIRTPGSPKILEALGAQGVNMPQADIIQGLDNLLIEGMVTSREVLKDFGYAEKIKFVLNKPLGQVSALAIMSKKTFEALPANVQDVIRELAPLAAAYAGEKLDAAVKESLDWAVSSQGVKVVELSNQEATKFDEALAPVTTGWLRDIAAKGLPADDFYQQLKDAAATYK